MSKDPALMSTHYEVIAQEDPESGDLILPIPQPVLDALGWKEGEEIDFDLREDGSFLLKRKST